MKDKTIKLKMNNIVLGTLSFEDNKYVFCGNEEGFRLAKTKTPIIPFVLNESGKTEYIKLPYPFSRFLVLASREDVKEQLNILDTDTDFDILVKYASSDIEPETFYISI